MELIDSASVPRSRDVVWKSLNDPELLRQVIPGYETLEVIPENRMRGQVTVKVGPVKARFTGEIAFSDVVSPKSHVLTGDDKGGIAGFAKGVAAFNLEEVGPDQTLLHYHARMDVGGKLAQPGARRLDSTAKKLGRQFFDDFCKVAAQDVTVSYSQ